MEINEKYLNKKLKEKMREIANLQQQLTQTRDIFTRLRTQLLLKEGEIGAINKLLQELKEVKTE